MIARPAIYQERTRTERPAMRVLVSTSWGSDLIPTVHPELSIRHVRRRNDWGMSGIRRQLFKARECLNLAWASRGHRAHVMLTAGPELVLAGLFTRLLAPRTRLVVADPLLPEAPGRLLRAGFRLVHRFVVIRRNDARLLTARFGLPGRAVSFAHWPGDLATHRETSDDGYVYAAGWAHRDWPMFLEAVQRLESHVIIAADLLPRGRHRRGRADVEIVGPLPPDQGRTLMRAASVVAMPLVDTDRPAGPLVLLDAMSAGKAVVATRTGGTVDYVRDRVDGLLVPPGDAIAFAAALQALLEAPELRAQLGEEARETASAFSSVQFWQTCYVAAVGQSRNQGSDRTQPGEPTPQSCDEG